MTRVRTMRLAGAGWLALGAVLVMASMATANTFTGRAYAAYLRAPALGAAGPLYLSDTGETSPNGGFAGAGGSGATVPLVLSVELLHAATSSANYEEFGGRAASASSLSQVRLLPGHLAELSAAFVRAESEAMESGVLGSVDIQALTFGGKAVQVTGLPNQRVVIPGLLGPLATLVINEQVVSESGPVKEIVVNALHLTLATGDEFVLASARSMVDAAGAVLLARGPARAVAPSWAVECGSSVVAPVMPPAAGRSEALSGRLAHPMPDPCFDFVRGSGWFAPTPKGPKRADFAFYAGRTEKGELKGGLWYVDRNTGMRIKATGITGYRASGLTSRIFEGPAEINGMAGYSFLAEVADDGDGGADRFRIALSNDYAADSGGAGHPTDPSGIDRGNIVLEEPCPPIDETPPQVSIASPADGAMVSGSVRISASATDDVGVKGVRFEVDGSTLGAEDISAPYEVSWDSSGAPDGEHRLTAVARDASGNSTRSSPVTVTVANHAPSAKGVEWIERVNTTSTGSTLEKTGGCSGCEDAGAVSAQTIDGGDGFVEFTARETGATRVVGLGSGNSGTTRADLEFGLQLWAGGNVEVREKGAYRAETTYAAGDRFRVAVESGVVRYYKNGAPIFTSSLTPSFPLRVDTSIYTVTGKVSDALVHGSGSGGPPDTTPPSVAVTSPAPGATVSGTVTVTADATDDVAVAGVQFRLDGAPLGAEDTSAPYSVSWDSTTTPDGDHTVTATARDGAGNAAGSSPVTVTVANAAPAGRRVEETDPSVTYTGTWIQGDLSRPWSGGTAAFSTEAGARATLSFDGASVSWVGFRGPQGGIARVFLDGALAAEVDTFASTEETGVSSFSATGLGAGAHTLAVEATGTKNAASSNTVVVVDAFDVDGGSGGTGDTTPPAVSVTSPSSGATVSGTVTVTADASDDVGVIGVQFRLDGTPLGVEDASAPYAVSWDSTTAPDGVHTLTATARDRAGNAGSSTPVVVTVANGPPSGATRFEEGDASYTGTWIARDTTTQPWSGGTAQSSVEEGAFATFAFTGTEIRWIGYRAHNTGIANIYLDGALVAEVDTYSPVTEVEAVVFTAVGLSAGTHTLKIEVTRRFHPASNGAWILVDAFDVTP